MYVTPTRFRAMGFGIDLSDVEDFELVSVLNRASALVDSFCSVPQLPTRHDFRGGSISGEQHNWRLGDPWLMAQMGSRRVYPFHAPISTIMDFRVKFTNTYEVEIDPANLYVDRSQNWAEVVSIAAVVSGVYPVGINFGLYTPVAEISYTYGWSFSVAGDVLTATDQLTFVSTNQWWKTSPVPVVYVNGVVQSTGYTVVFDEGVVIFDDPLPASDIVTVDYSYKLPVAIAEATGVAAAHLLGERDLQRKGMAGIGMLSVAEVTLRREGDFRAGGRSASLDAIGEIEPEIGLLLSPYVYMTAR